MLNPNSSFQRLEEKKIKEEENKIERKLKETWVQTS